MQNCGLNISPTLHLEKDFMGLHKTWNCFTPLLPYAGVQVFHVPSRRVGCLQHSIPVLYFLRRKTAGWKKWVIIHQRSSSLIKAKLLEFVCACVVGRGTESARHKRQTCNPGIFVVLSVPVRGQSRPRVWLKTSPGYQSPYDVVEGVKMTIWTMASSFCPY